MEKNLIWVMGLLQVSLIEPFFPPQQLYISASVLLRNRTSLLLNCIKTSDTWDLNVFVNMESLHSSRHYLKWYHAHFVCKPYMGNTSMQTLDLQNL